MLSDFAFGIIPVWREQPGLTRYLLICHRQGHWGFPKGHRDAEESDLMAAQREFEEETGLRNYQVFPEVEFVERYQFRKKKGALVAKTVKYYPALVQPPAPGYPPQVTVQTSEISDFRWCLAREAEVLLNFGASRQILADCEAWWQSQF